MSICRAILGLLAFFRTRSVVDDEQVNLWTRRSNKKGRNYIPQLSLSLPHFDRSDIGCLRGKLVWRLGERRGTFLYF